MNTRDSLLESIDLECFLDHIAPGEWERFIDKEMAFDFFTRDMTPQELKKELDESECRNEPEPWPAFEGLKKAVNDLVDANDRLLGEIGDLRHEMGMYREYWLAAEEYFACGVPIPTGSQERALMSVRMARVRMEEWQNDL